MFLTSVFYLAGSMMTWSSLHLLL